MIQRDKCRADIARLAAANCDWYDFTDELRRQQDRLIDLETGRDVTVYRHELPAQLVPPRDGTLVFTLRGDRLTPAR